MQKQVRIFSHQTRRENAYNGIHKNVHVSQNFKLNGQIHFFYHE